MPRSSGRSAAHTDPTVGRVLSATVGLAFGAATALVEAVFVVLTSPALLAARSRAHVFAAARSLAELERRRLARYHDSRNSPDYDGGRAFEYLAARCVVGGLGAGIFLLILWGLVSAAVLGYELVAGLPIGVGDDSDWYDPIAVLLLGVLLLFLAVQGLVGVAKLDRGLAHHFLGPSEQELLRRRVSELATTRAQVLEAVTDERRRIERDLHDGVQQRLVALGMVLGRALRASDPDHTRRLVTQAHDESQEALRDLREVTWRVYPIALDSGGLRVALESLAERSSLPVAVEYTLDGRPEAAVETVAYFVASEAVTNAVKHSGANRATIAVSGDATMVTVRISDDGSGGARDYGGGLSGLARRVAAADGVFVVDSPPGGPTVVTAELPCA